MGLLYFVIGVIVGALLLIVLPLFIAVLGVVLAVGGVIALPLILAVLILVGFVAVAPGIGLGSAARCHPDRVVIERPQAAPASVNSSAFEQRGVVQRRVLSAHRISERVFEAARALPLGSRADSTVAADLVDAPIDFEPVVVWVAKLDRGAGNRRVGDPRNRS
jgi:hypothetical protein